MRFVPRIAISVLAVVVYFALPNPLLAAEVQDEAFRLALRSAARMGKAWSQDLYAQIAVAQARTGRLAAARSTLETAYANPPQRYSDGSMTCYPERSLAVALALTGRPREAIESARKVRSASSRAIALAETAAALPPTAVRAEGFREAVALAANGAEPEVHNRLETLIEIAKHQHAAACIPEALGTLQIAAAVAEARTQPYARALSFSQVARAMVEIGARNAAVEVFGRAREAGATMEAETARTDLVRAAIAVGRLDIAQLEAQAVRHSDERLDALCETGIAYAERGDRAKAESIFDLALADMKAKPYQWQRRFLHMQMLARLAHNARVPEKAIALINEQVPAAREMPGALVRSSMLVYEGQALSELGLEARAVEVLREAAAEERLIEWDKVEGFAPPPDATPHLVRSLLRLGDVKEAEKTAAAFKDLGGRTLGLEQMVRVAAEAGCFRLAVRCAERIPGGGGPQVRAYLLIATSAAKSRE